jgi:hypothetical protein
VDSFGQVILSVKFGEGVLIMVLLDRKNPKTSLFGET